MTLLPGENAIYFLLAHVRALENTRMNNTGYSRISGTVIFRNSFRFLTINYPFFLLKVTQFIKF